jgi:hypothetical protein
MKQIPLPLEDDQSAPAVIALEAEQEQQLIELMAQALAAVLRLGQGEQNESS